MTNYRLRLSIRQRLKNNPFLWCNLFNSVLYQILSQFTSWTAEIKQYWSIYLSWRNSLCWDNICWNWLRLGLNEKLASFHFVILRLWLSKKLTSSYFIYLRTGDWNLVFINYLLNQWRSLNFLRNNDLWSWNPWCMNLLNKIWIDLRRLHNFWLEVWSINIIWLNLFAVFKDDLLTKNWSLSKSYWFLNGFLSSEWCVILSMALLWNCIVKTLWVSVC